MWPGGPMTRLLNNETAHNTCGPAHWPAGPVARWLDGPVARLLNRETQFMWLSTFVWSCDPSSHYRSYVARWPNGPVA